MDGYERKRNLTEEAINFQSVAAGFPLVPVDKETLPSPICRRADVPWKDFSPSRTRARYVFSTVRT